MAPGPWGYSVGHPRVGRFYRMDDDAGGQLSCHPAMSYSGREEKSKENTVQGPVEGTAIRPSEKHD